jgi:hypothetical protein
LDLTKLRQREEAVGTLQALGELSAPVALGPGKQPADALIVPALRAALRSELGRTLAVAEPAVFGGIAPNRVREPRTSSKKASASRVPDALDRLMAGAYDDDTLDDTDDPPEMP